VSKINNVLFDLLFRVINYYDINKIKALSWVKSPNFNQQLRVLRKDENKINIAFIDTDFAVGGAQKVTLDIGNMLPTHRFKTAYVATECFGLKKDWRDKFKEVFNDLIDLRTVRNKGEKLLRVISYLRPDIIVIINSKIAYSVVPIIRKEFPEISLIDIIHGAFDWQHEHVFFLEYVRYFDKRIIVSDGLRKSILNRYMNENLIASYGDKVMTIKNSTDIPLANNMFSKSDYRNKLDIPFDAFVVVFVGAIAYHKDPLSVITIARTVKKEQDVHFVIFGDGPLRKRVTFEISKAGLSNTVHVIEDSNGVHDILIESDVLILPSLIDSMPLVILEAMARGKPVIAANVGSISEIIRNEKNGCLVDRNDDMIENFVQKILRLKNDKELYERLKSNALSEVNRKFDLADSVDRYIHVFEDVSDARKAIPQ
tara:strand:+ start:1612 stop:2892 length:1281 start_codon:yes stop_codon:yes gene_type:complete